MKFNPNGKTILTTGESFGPAMEITDAVDAEQYLRDCVTYLQGFLDKEPRTDGLTAEQIVKANLRYYAGYYDAETQTRVKQLFKL